MSSVPIGTLANLPGLLDELGFDGWAFLQGCGLEADAFARPLRPVPITFCGEVMQRALAFSHCDALALLLGDKARMDNLGPLRLLLDATPRVRDAVEALIRFRRIWFSSFQICLSEERGMACMAIDFPGHFAGHQALRTSFVTGMVRHLDLILGTRLAIRELHLTRLAPADPAPYMRLFGLLPRFAQLRDAVFFDAALLEHTRSVRHDPQLGEFLRRQLVALQGSAGDGFLERMADLIETLLMSGHCSVEAVAQVLGMHRLTLYRRLQQLGTTFEALLDQRRCELAQAMLRRHNIGIGEIADALGYSATSNFSRAFVRWMGVSPGRWRQQSEAAADATAAETARTAVRTSG